MAAPAGVIYESANVIVHDSELHGKGEIRHI
jgi:hypothetical protein